jgi:hypothetical protein
MDDNITFEQFIVAASSYSIESRKELRIGQAYMGSLMFYRPDLYDNIMSISLEEIWDVNPYYNDSKLPNFLAYIASRWNDQATIDNHFKGMTMRLFNESGVCLMSSRVETPVINGDTIQFPPFKISL